MRNEKPGGSQIGGEGALGEPGHLALSEVRLQQAMGVHEAVMLSVPIPGSSTWAAEAKSSSASSQDMAGPRTEVFVTGMSRAGVA